ncbi:MAG: 50S ribosomal protein L21 [bacterium]
MSKIAVIKTGGKQYNVKSKDKIKIEKINGEAGDKVDFNEVLLVADEDGKEVKIGKPFVEGAKVEAVILRHARAKKITVIKYKAKVRYRRKLGHKQHFTEVEIGAIA